MRFAFKTKPLPTKPIKAKGGSHAKSRAREASFDPKVVEKPQQELVRKDGTAEAIASLPSPVLLTSATKSDLKNILWHQLSDLTKLVERAKYEYLRCADNENASSMTGIITEIRGLSQDIFTLDQEDKDLIFNELNVRVVIPLFRKIVQSIITEVSSLRTDLSRACGPETDEQIDKLLKRMVRNFKPMFSREYDDFLTNLSKIIKSDVDFKPLIEKLDRAMDGT